MPIKKIRQSAGEARKSGLYLNQLRADGLDIGIDPEPAAVPEPCPLEITQVDVGTICDLPNNNTLYLLPVRVVPQAQTICADCHIVSPWDTYSIYFPYLSELDGRYRFGPVNLRVEDVFNDILQSNRAMKRAAILEGTIVGYGCEPIPAREGSATVPVQITLVDTLGREITAEIRCSVEHKTKDERAALQATKSRVPESLQE